MATVKGPLHSEEAHGTVGKQLTYRKTKRGHTVTAHNYPGSRNTSTPSTAQTTVRAATRLIMKTWPTLTPTEKATWTAAAIAAPRQPINFFQQINFARLAAGKLLSRSYPPPPPAAAYRTVTATSGTPYPDARGRYDRIADYNGQPAYKRSADPSYYLVWSTTLHKWIIDRQPDNAIEPPAWSRTGVIYGPYTPTSPATGTITVSAETPAVL